MMEAIVYTAYSDDAAKWDEAATRVVKGDAYFRSGYARACEISDGGTVFCFHLSDGECEGLEVLMVREVAGLPFLAEGETYLDAATPYGYGGPVFNEAARASESFQNEFFRGLDACCRERNIIARFVRFHPMLENHLQAQNHMEVTGRQTTVYMDLENHIDPMDTFSGSMRAKVRKAFGQGLRFRELEGGKSLEEFRRLYDATMRRVGASSIYFFPSSYYEALSEGLSGALRLFGVYHKDRRGERLASAGLFLFGGGEMAHYHLGASDEEFLPMRPNNLMFCEAARTLRAEGAMRVHLGGGIAEGDSLYRFKAGLGKGRSRFSTGHHVILRNRYRDLVKRWEVHYGSSAEAISYFPVYRAPGPKQGSET